jgi:hypothetical protein
LRPLALGASKAIVLTDPCDPIALAAPIVLTEQALLAQVAAAIMRPVPIVLTEQALLAQLAAAIMRPAPIAPTEQTLLAHLVAATALTVRLATTARLSTANASVTAQNSAGPLAAVAHGPARAGKIVQPQVARALTPPAEAMSVSKPHRLPGLPPGRHLVAPAERPLPANPNVSRKCSPAWASHPVARRKSGFAPAASPSTGKSPCWATALAAQITCASTAV